MVSRLSAAAVMLVAGFVPARAELDLTPDLREESFEGAPKSVMVFKDGEAEVRYDVPVGWVVSGGASALTLRPPGSDECEAVIRVLPLPGEGGLSERAVEALQAEFAGKIPEESVVTAVWSEPVINPMRMNGHPTVLFAVEYTLVGERFKRSWLVCHFARQQVRFEFRARLADYAGCYEPFRSSLYSWNGLE